MLPLSDGRTLGVPRNADDLQSVKFADIICAIAEDRPLTKCVRMCFAGSEADHSEPHDQGND